MTYLWALTSCPIVAPFMVELMWDLHDGTTRLVVLHRKCMTIHELRSCIIQYISKTNHT